MIHAISQGIVLGLILSALIGPVFFLLIKTSMKNGFKAALIMELGIISSDAFCIFLSYIGMASIFNNPLYKSYFIIIGSAVLMVFGVSTFLSHKKINSESDLIKSSNTKLILKGFFFNISNPSALFFWIGTVGLAVTQFANSVSKIIVYFLSTLLTVFALDLLKAYSAKAINEKINDYTLGIITRIAGIGIFLFGVYLIIDFYFVK
ncbi:MAG: LysE family transporter [Bacteroidota bacterium]|jgi:threonine/homoserine/homoserine lactone efflux protein